MPTILMWAVVLLSGASQTGGSIAPNMDECLKVQQMFVQKLKEYNTTEADKVVAHVVICAKLEKTAQGKDA